MVRARLATLTAAIAIPLAGLLVAPSAIAFEPHLPPWTEGWDPTPPYVPPPPPVVEEEAPYPDTVIDGSKVKGRKGVATLSFRASTAEATFMCKLDSQPVFRSCDSPKTYRHLTPGRHQFAVAAIDSMGAADPTPAVLTFTVKASMPRGFKSGVRHSSAPRTRRH